MKKTTKATRIEQQQETQLQKPSRFRNLRSWMFEAANPSSKGFIPPKIVEVVVNADLTKNQIEQAKQYPGVSIDLEDYDESSKMAHLTFKSIDNASAYLFSELEMTPTTSQTLKQTIVPTLYQELLRSLLEDDSLQQELPLRLFLLVSLENHTMGVELQSITTPDASSYVTVRSFNQPNSESLEKGAFIDLRSKAASTQFADTRLNSLSGEDVSQLLALQKAENNRFSPEERETILERTGKYIAEWFKRFNKEPASVNHGHKFYTDTPHTHIKGNSITIPLTITTRNNKKSIEYELKIDLEHQPQAGSTFIQFKVFNAELYTLETEIQKELVRSTDPFVRSHRGGSSDLKTIVDQTMKTIKNFIFQYLQTLDSIFRLHTKT